MFQWNEQMYVLYKDFYLYTQNANKINVKIIVTQFYRQ